MTIKELEVLYQNNTLMHGTGLVHISSYQPYLMIAELTRKQRLLAFLLIERGLNDNYYIKGSIQKIAHTYGLSTEVVERAIKTMISYQVIVPAVQALKMLNPYLYLLPGMQPNSAYHQQKCAEYYQYWQDYAARFAVKHPDKPAPNFIDFTARDEDVACQKRLHALCRKWFKESK